jgi:hypothetical protein
LDRGCHQALPEEAGTAGAGIENFWHTIIPGFENLVGVAGFEPATPSSRTRRSIIRLSKFRRFSSRLAAFVSFCSRCFVPQRGDQR